MRHLVTLLFVILLLSACASARNTSSSAVSGPLQVQQLLSQYPAFEEQFRRYTPGQKELEAMRTLKDKSLLVFLGTWCHDSVREVPRLLKLLEQSGVGLQQLQLVAVGLDKKKTRQV